MLMYILIGTIGLVVGFILGNLLYFKIVHKSGTLITNVNDPDRDIYRLEITDNLDALPDKKYIILKVKNL